MTQKKSLLTRIVKALFPRSLFFLHGMFCIWLLVEQEQNSQYWYLMFCLGGLVLEGIFNAVVRHGKEFHWFCPSAFLYCLVLIVTMTTLREGQIICIQEIDDRNDGTQECSKDELKGAGGLTKVVNAWGTAYAKRVSLIEQTGLLVLIIGRWLLPQGTISREQFSQILLIYIGTAADIVEFSEIYGEDNISKKLRDETRKVLEGLMAVWGLSVIQFSLTIALPEDGLKQEDEEEEEEEELFEETSYFRSKIQNKVTPMSYMHYKSMMRDGFNQNENQNGTLSSSPSSQKKNPLVPPNSPVTQRRNPFQAQQAFYEKSNRLSKTLNSIQVEGHRYNRGTFSESSRPPLPPINKSKGGVYNSKTDIPITLPHGERVPRNIGSPESSLRSLRNNTSSQSRRSYKQQTSANKSPSLNSKKIGSPQSIRSYKLNNERKNSLTRRNKLSSSDSPDNASLRKVSRIEKILNRIPFSYNKKPLERKDSTKEDNSLGIGKKEVKNCFINHLELIGILLPVCMQDGPFFIARLVLVAHYQVITEMIFLLIVKNALVIFVQIYRILIMYCTEPKPRDYETDEASNRVRTAMNSNSKLSSKNFRGQKASIAIQAIARFNQRLHDKNEQMKSTRKVASHLNGTIRETTINMP